MALPVQQFPILSFQQANPFLTGVQAGSDVMGSIANNAMKAQQLKYLPQQMQSQLLQALAKANQSNAAAKMDISHGQLYDAQTPWVAPQAQANILAKNAQAANSYSQVPLNQARTQYTNTENSYYPQSLYLRNIALQNSANRNQIMDNNSAIGSSNLANQPDLLLSNINRQRAQGGLPPLNINDAQQQGLIQASQDTAAGNAFKKTNSADVVKRTPAGARFDTSYKTAQYWLDKGADQYFGVKGQSQLLKDILSSTVTGKTPDSLISWNNFKSALENMNVQGAFLEGVPADQISRGQYSKIFNINNISNNPQSARKLLENAYNLGLSASKVNISPLGGYLQPGGLEKTAQQATTLPQKQSNSSINIPSFSNKQQFNQWLDSLSPSQHAAVIAQLNGKR